MQLADHQMALAGGMLILGLRLRVKGATSLDGLIRGSVELGQANYLWEESIADPESSTDDDARLKTNIDLLDAIWQKLVVTDFDHHLEREAVSSVAAAKISQALRKLIADSVRETTKDLFAPSGI